MAGHGEHSISIPLPYDDDLAGHSNTHAAARLRRAGHNVSTGRRHRGSSTSSSFSSSPGPHSRSGQARSAPTTGKVNIRVLFILVALVSLAWSLYQLPLNRVIERRLCAEYYRSLHDGTLSTEPGLARRDGNENNINQAKGNVKMYEEIPEEKCKVDEVQRGLGRIQGFMETGWVVGDFVMTIPLIAIADRYGHGVVLLLNLVPRIILLVWTFAVGYFDGMLPAKAITVAPLFSVLGGDCVFNSIVYSLVSSATEDVVQRATYFGQMNAVSSIFAYQLGPALASASMSVLLWLPLWLGIILLLLAIPIISHLNLPSPIITCIPSVSKQRQSNELQMQLEEGSPLLSAASSSQTNLKNSLDIPSLIKKRFYALTEIITSYPANFTLLLTGFFLTSLASSDTKLLTQYISKRYNWRFTSVGYLLSGKAVFNFFLLYFLIPALLKWRERPVRVMEPDMDPEEQEQALAADADDGEMREKDNTRRTISHAHICLVFSVLGAMAISSSATIYLLIPSLLLYALGIALPMFTYSLLRAECMLPRSQPYSQVQGQSRSEGARTRTHRRGSTPSDDYDEDEVEEEEEEEEDYSTKGNKDGASTAQIFSIVMLVKQSGMLVGAPLMASLWVYGLGVGGIGLGLPYFVSAVCYGVVIFVFARIRV